jgi:hypothetical protein
LALVLAFGECPGSKKADEVILTGCTISQIERKAEMSAQGVRREKAALSSGCKSHPATAPAGSNRSSHGGNEMAEASG